MEGIMFAPRRRSIIAVLGTVVFGLALASCDGSTEPEEEEPEVATMRLTINAQTVDIAENGSVSGGPIVVPVGNTAISAAFLRADGSADPVVTADVFRLDVDSDNAGIASFSRSGAFNGNLVGTAAGSTILRFSLFHIEEGHEDFGPFPVAVTVQ
jgi:hypothetical protein